MRIVPVPWGDPWMLPGRVLGLKRSKSGGDRASSQFHGPAGTLSALFTCLHPHALPAPPDCRLLSPRSFCTCRRDGCIGPKVRSCPLTAPSGVHTRDPRAALTGNRGPSSSTAAHRRDLLQNDLFYIKLENM